MKWDEDLPGPVDHEFLVLLTMMKELGVTQGALNIKSADDEWLTVVQVTRYPRRVPFNWSQLNPFNWFKKQENKLMT